MGEIGDAVQVISMSIQGMEFAFKVTKSLGKDSLKILGVLLKALTVASTNVHNAATKEWGSIPFTTLMKEDRNVKPFQCLEKDFEEVCKNLRKYDIPYSVLPDINRGDDFRELVIHEKSINRLNLMLEKMGIDVNETNFSDYAKNTDSLGIDELEKQYQKAKEAGEIKPEAEVKKNYVEHKFSSNEELKHDLRYQELKSNKNNIEITVNKKSLNCVETDFEMISRIPGKKDQFILLPKTEIFRTDPTKEGGFKTYLGFLNPEKMYNVYDKENKPVGIVTGSDLQKRYANVEREHFKKPQQKKPAKSK